MFPIDTYTLLRIDASSAEDLVTKLRTVGETKLSPALAAAGVLANGIWFEIILDGKSLFRLKVDQ